MIFDISADNWEDKESYKERNLYYKIFAGYLFNEIIPGEEERKNSFIDLLKDILKENDRIIDKDNKLPAILSEIRKENIHVTFDYHSAQLDGKDRGEMSDILLLAGSYFISIECKFLENMRISKDVEEVQSRIKTVKETGKLGINPIQILLLKESKWLNSKRAGKKEESFYTLFQKEKMEEYEIPVIVLFWDELIKLIPKEDKKVKEYLFKQINRKKRVKQK